MSMAPTLRYLTAENIQYVVILASVASPSPFLEAKPTSRHDVVM
jgi:hypothetical protein